jgi:hypothetical protein
VRETSTPGAASNASDTVPGWKRAIFPRSMYRIVADERSLGCPRSASTRTGDSVVTVSDTPM